MKVIKEGYVKPKNRITCKSCGCIFEYNKGDIETIKKEWTEIDYSLYLNEWKCTEDIDYVECPTCKTHYKVGGRNYTRDIIPFSKRFMGENYEK